MIQLLSIMAWQGLLNNQLSLPNVSTVCQFQSNQRIWRYLSLHSRSRYVFTHLWKLIFDVQMWEDWSICRNSKLMLIFFCSWNNCLATTILSSIQRSAERFPSATLTLCQIIFWTSEPLLSPDSPASRTVLFGLCRCTVFYVNWFGLG